MPAATELDDDTRTLTEPGPGPATPIPSSSSSLDGARFVPGTLLESLRNRGIAPGNVLALQRRRLPIRRPWRLQQRPGSKTCRSFDF